MGQPENNAPEVLNKAAARKLIILVGVVSLFSDMTYEGARSITGPFLRMLNASATVVGIVAGLGEFIGYALQPASGYLTDLLGKYWGITFVGYALNLFAVPLLALAGNWEMAAPLILTEMLGKAVRTPARDAMLSHATTEVGRGWGFGFHEAMLCVEANRPLPVVARKQSHGNAPSRLEDLRRFLNPVMRRGRTGPARKALRPATAR
jgi:hypothetical protein